MKKTLKTIAGLFLAIIPYTVLIALRIQMLPYPNTPKVNWSYITGNKPTADDFAKGIALLISFMMQVLFLATGLNNLFWITFGITHFFVFLHKLVAWFGEIEKDFKPKN